MQSVATVDLVCPTYQRMFQAIINALIFCFCVRVLYSLSSSKKTHKLHHYFDIHCHVIELTVTACFVLAQMTCTPIINTFSEKKKYK